MSPYVSLGFIYLIWPEKAQEELTGVVRVACYHHDLVAENRWMGGWFSMRQKARS